MTENQHLHAIFKHIDSMLWEHAEADVDKLPIGGKIHERRAKHISLQSKRLQNVVIAYFEQQTIMMHDLMGEDRFWQFPLPTKRTHLWSRLRLRLKLWKATRTLLSGELLDSGSNPTQEVM